MLDDFFTRALLAGIGIALMSGPLGCMIVWRRMSFVGDTLAHASLLGIAFGVMLNVTPLYLVFLTGILVSLILFWAQKTSFLSSDTWLAVLSHGALALGLMLFSVIARSSANFLRLLLGDVLSVTRTDIVVIWSTAILVLLLMAFIWKDLLRVTIHKELAQAEGARPDRANLIFACLLALVIALAIQMVGVLLVTALLIIPAAAARQGASSPEMMALMSSILGIVSVVLGLFASSAVEIPSGPSIVVAALGLFVLALLARKLVVGYREKQLVQRLGDGE